MAWRACEAFARRGNAAAALAGSGTHLTWHMSSLTSPSYVERSGQRTDCTGGKGTDAGHGRMQRRRV